MANRAQWLTRSVVSWFVWSLLFSISAGQYIKTTSDVFAPVVISQAVAAALSCIISPTKKIDDGAGSSSRHRGWMLGLGMLQCMVSLLTLASFAATSVADTLVVRMLEPVCSCILVFVVHGRKCTRSELLLSAVTGLATAHVVLAGGHPGSTRAAAAAVSTSSSSSSIWSAAQGVGSSSHHWSLQGAAKAGSSYIPLCLAVMATLLVSCRSVASKAVAAASRSPEYELFLQASVPGLAGALILQCAVQAFSGFGLLPSGLAVSSGSRLSTQAAATALLVCAVSQFAYSAASSQVLQVCSPVVHSVLNVCKRVAMIVASALLLGRPMNAAQIGSLAVASAAAAAFALRQAAGGNAAGIAGVQGSGGSTWGKCSGKATQPPTTATTLVGLPAYLSSGPSEPVSRGAFKRLACVTGLILALSFVCLGSVLPTLGAVVPQNGQQQPYQQQPPSQQQLLSKWHLLPSFGQYADAPSNLFDVSVSSLHHNAVDGTAAPNAASAADASSFGIDSLSAHAKQYISEEVGRLQCLNALHNASKTALAPFLANRAAGGIALYDVALHNNLGDAMLWAAAARLVPTFHNAVKYVCAQAQLPGRNSQALKHFPKCNIKKMMHAIGRDGVVMLSPGGNWGDLWWPVHSQRLQYLQAMAAQVKAVPVKGAPSSKKLKVVQLPQSLSFSNATNMQMDATIINALPADMLTLFARQDSSIEYAKSHYPTTRVLPAPDLALSLGPLMPGGAPVYDVLFLLRQDKEAQGSEQLVRDAAAAAAANGSRNNPANASSSSSSSGVGSGGSGAAALDSLQELERLNVSYTMREWDFAHMNFSREASQVALVHLAESRLQGAMDVISQGKVIVTNRLHAAVMANLLGRPLIWIDTEQKKLSGVRAHAWSYSSACTEENMHSIQADDFSSAVRIAARWLSTPGFTWSVQQVQLSAPPLPAATKRT